MQLKLLVLAILKLKYCGMKRKYWFPAILYNSTLTLKAFIGFIDISEGLFKHNLVFNSLEKEQSFLV